MKFLNPLQRDAIEAIDDYGTVKELLRLRFGEAIKREIEIGGSLGAKRDVENDKNANH